MIITEDWMPFVIKDILLEYIIIQWDVMMYRLKTLETIILTQRKKITIFWEQTLKVNSISDQ